MSLSCRVKPEPKAILTVVRAITSVTTISLVDSDGLAGQSVMLAAQLVIVWIEVVSIVMVVRGPESVEDELY
jgi:hypothetical protein